MMKRTFVLAKNTDINGVTGEIMYVDAGFSTVGMSFPEEAAGE